MSCFTSLPRFENCPDDNNTLSWSLPPPLGQEALAPMKKCSVYCCYLLAWPNNFCSCMIKKKIVNIFFWCPKSSRFPKNVGKKNEQKKSIQTKVQVVCFYEPNYELRNMKSYMKSYTQPSYTRHRIFSHIASMGSIFHLRVHTSSQNSHQFTWMF